MRRTGDRQREPERPSGTPDERAEAIIGAAMASDVLEQQEVVRRSRESLALGRRYHGHDRDETLRLESALGAAERYLAVIERRQADWRRNRAFDRDLVERVLLMARIADFREAARRGREAVSAPPPVRATADEVPPVTNVDAVARYLRAHSPPLPG